MVKWLEDQPPLQAGLKRTLESVSPRARRQFAWMLLVRASKMTLEFSLLPRIPHLFWFHCTRCKSRARRRHPLTSACTPHLPSSSPLIELKLAMISAPLPEPRPRAYPSHLLCRIKSVFMKKEMARLKDSEPDIPHRER